MRLIASLLIVSLAGAAAVLSAVAVVDGVEDSTRTGVARALADSAQDWSRVRVDGLDVVLTGEAPDEAARFAAIKAVGHVVDTARIVDRITVTPAAEIAAPTFALEILRNVDGISLIGLVPADQGRAAMLDRLGRISEAPVTDLMETGSYPVPDGWAEAVDFALDALAGIRRAKVSVAPGRVEVVGLADSAEDKAAIEARLRGGAPAGLDLALDISAPRPVIAPFTVRFVIDEGGARFDTCAAAETAGRRAIVAAARRAGAEADIDCDIGLGSPSTDWSAAVVAGIDALSRLGRGKLTFSDADVSVVVPHDVASDAFDAEMGALSRALPDEFTLTPVHAQPPADADAARAEADAAPLSFTAILAPDGAVSLRGRLPDERMQAVVDSYARGLFGAETTQSATRAADGVPGGWTLEVLAALDALSHLSEGQVVMRPDLLTVSGRTSAGSAEQRIARMLGDRLPDGANFELDVTYDAQAAGAADRPTAEECVARLGTVQRVRKVTFEPGSSTIDTDGLEIIDQLADILRDCAQVPMEIAGHTDSQGRETMNLSLSQARADAVVDALMARRVLTQQLTAKGYGEVAPIADNDTAEGREANRRIEFTLLREEQDGPVPEGETGTGGDPEAAGESSDREGSDQ